MNKPIIPDTLFLVACIGFSLCLNAQPKTTEDLMETKIRVAKPYKVLTNGRQITIQSKQKILNVMVWTTSGHRITEAKNINEPSFTFSIFVNEKIFFVLIEFADGKRFTEKIGIK
jgi:hypothetical protein